MIERRRLVYSTETLVCARCGWPATDCRCSSGTPRKEPARSGRVTAKLRMEKRSSGRAVTVVEGLQRAELDLPSLLRDWKRACGTGGALSEGVIELQGDQRERLRPMLLKNGWTVKG